VKGGKSLKKERLSEGKRHHSTFPTPTQNAKSAATADVAQTHTITHSLWHPLTSFHSHKDVQINMTGAGLNPKIVQSEMNA